MKRLYASLVPPELAVFPEIETDLADCKPLLKGKVLNAGAGWCDVSRLVEGELINQDITWPGDKRTNIQIYSPFIGFRLTRTTSTQSFALLFSSTSRTQKEWCRSCTEFLNSVALTAIQ